MTTPSTADVIAHAISQDADLEPGPLTFAILQALKDAGFEIVSSDALETQHGWARSLVQLARDATVVPRTEEDRDHLRALVRVAEEALDECDLQLRPVDGSEGS